MSTIKSPYRNKMMTPAKVQARITIDLLRRYLREQVRFNSNAYLGGSISTPNPISTGLRPVGPTEVDIGIATEIDLGEVETDALNSYVDICCQNINSGVVFKGLQSMSRVAGRVTFFWYVDGDNLMVKVFNDSDVAVNVMAWYVMA